MTTLLEELRAVAEKKIEPLLTRREELRKELAEIDADLAAAQRALAALDGKPAEKPAKPTKKRRQQKRSAPEEEVLAKMAEVLEAGGGKMPRTDLLDTLKEKLALGGYGLTGLKQRFERLLGQDDRFACRGASVNLSSKAT